MNQAPLLLAPDPLDRIGAFNGPESLPPLGALRRPWRFHVESGSVLEAAKSVLLYAAVAAVAPFYLPVAIVNVFREERQQKRRYREENALAAAKALFVGPRLPEPGHELFVGPRTLGFSTYWYGEAIDTDEWWRIVTFGPYEFEQADDSRWRPRRKPSPCQLAADNWPNDHVVAMMQPGDEVRSYSNRLFNKLCGRAGLSIWRGGTPIVHIETFMN